MKFLKLSLLYLGAYSLFLPINAQDLPLEPKENFTWETSKDYQNILLAQSLMATDPTRKWSTNALLIIKDDTIIFEKYYNGFSQDQKQRIWSISKSVSSALIGVGIKKNLISYSTKASLYFPSLKGDERAHITVEHLLGMSSGLDWIEGYELNPFNSHVVKMLYLKESENMPDFVSMRKLTHRPGQVFHYSSGETNLLLGILKKAIDDEKRYQDFPWQELFTPLGIVDATWEQDSKKNYIGSSYLYLLPRDLAKIAKLYLNHGSWLSNQIISKNFVLKSIKPTSASCLTAPTAKKYSFTYGHHWWLNGACPEDSNRRVYKNLPRNLVLGLGHHGQTLAIFPSQNAIAIRMGADKKGAFDREAWLELVFKELVNIPKLKNAGGNVEKL